MNDPFDPSARTLGEAAPGLMSRFVQGEKVPDRYETLMRLAHGKLLNTVELTYLLRDNYIIRTYTGNPESETNAWVDASVIRRGNSDPVFVANYIHIA